MPDKPSPKEISRDAKNLSAKVVLRQPSSPLLPLHRPNLQSPSAPASEHLLALLPVVAPLKAVRLRPSGTLLMPLPNRLQGRTAPVELFGAAFGGRVHDDEQVRLLDADEAGGDGAAG